MSDGSFLGLSLGAVACWCYYTYCDGDDARAKLKATHPQASEYALKQEFREGCSENFFSNMFVSAFFWPIALPWKLISRMD